MFHRIAQICQTIFILVVLIYALLSIWSPNIVYAETIRGKARVIDGDTIEVNNEKIRLLCIDTPESNYKGKTQYCLDNETDCGDLAKKALKEVIDKKEVWCEYEKRDIYGRILGMCQEYSYWNTYPYWGTYNYEMIYNGYAWFYPGNKECKPFKEAFQEAQKEHRGLFDEDIGGFKDPKAWRKTRSNN